MGGAGAAGDRGALPVLRAVSGMLGDRPAILPWQVRQQSQDEGPCATSRFDPREAARDPAHRASNRSRQRAGSTLWPAATA